MVTIIWPEIIRLKKLDAAERQLKKAIWMFFGKEDPVPLQTIAAAAHQILVDIGTKRGKISFIKDNPWLRPDKKKEWIAIINQAPNFFKHADRDGESEFEFRPNMIQHYLLDSISLYSQIRGELFWEASVFQGWFIAKHPDLFVEGPAKEFATLASARSIDLDDFQTIMEVLRTAQR